jgi:hypothetical protein
VIAIVAVSLLALLGLGALTVDTGSWFGDGRRVQSLADAGGIAGAQSLATAHSPSTAQAAAQASVTNNLNPGGLYGSSSPSNPPTCTAVASPSGLAGSTYDTMTVTCDRNSPSFLANLFGIHSAHVRETAKVRVFGLNKLAGVVPIAVDQSDAKRWASLPSVTLYYHGGGEEEDDEHRFGFLDLSAYGCPPLGTTNTTVLNGLASCIRSGAPSTITVPADICRARPQLDEHESEDQPEPANDYSTYRQAIDLAVQSRTGQQLYVPVYSSSSGDDDEHESGSSCGGSSGGDSDDDDEEEGSRGSYHIVGFAVFLLQSSNFVEHSESEGGDDDDDEKGFVSLTGQFQGIIQGTSTGGACLCGANVVSVIQ